MLNNHGHLSMVIDMPKFHTINDLHRLLLNFNPPLHLFLLTVYTSKVRNHHQDIRTRKLPSNSILDKTNTTPNISISKDISLPLEQLSPDLNHKIGNCISLAVTLDRAVADP